MLKFNINWRKKNLNKRWLNNQEKKNEFVIKKSKKMKKEKRKK